MANSSSNSSSNSNHWNEKRTEEFMKDVRVYLKGLNEKITEASAVLESMKITKRQCEEILFKGLPRS